MTCPSLWCGPAGRQTSRPLSSPPEHTHHTTGAAASALSRPLCYSFFLYSALIPLNVSKAGNEQQTLPKQISLMGFLLCLCFLWCLSLSNSSWARSDRPKLLSWYQGKTGSKASSVHRDLCDFWHFPIRKGSNADLSCGGGRSRSRGGRIKNQFRKLQSSLNRLFIEINTLCMSIKCDEVCEQCEAFSF